MSVYYNEIDKKASQWLRELIKGGLIPAGEVDERSIEDVKPGEVKGFDQCHFFAGIGGWAEALRLAGWGRRRVWTGSCPCQPFSVAGQKKGTKDRRHLWPAFFELIRSCHPSVIFSEQVSAAIRHGWIDGVRSGLEEEGYSCGFHVLGAHSLGAPHIRQRLYWVAYSGRPDDRGAEDPYDEPRAGAPDMSGGAGAPGGLGDSQGDNQRGDTVPGGHREGESARGPGGHVFWGSVWHPCRDGKTRRIPVSVASEPVFQRMADGIPGRVDEMRPESGFPVCAKVEGRVLLLKGYGNAIVPPLAAEFVKCFMEAISSPVVS